MPSPTALNDRRDADYYRRTVRPNTDGTPLYACDADTRNEAEAVRVLEERWRCEIKPFGKLCPVDFYALRDNRIVGVLELKSRTHPRDRYPSVFLNVRKWLALTMASVGMGCPAVFVVRFPDGLFYVRLSDIPTGAVAMGGTRQRVKSHTDVEPVLRVPVALFSEVR